MKNLKELNSQQEYNNFVVGNEFADPNVSLIHDENNQESQGIVYSKDDVIFEIDTSNESSTTLLWRVYTNEDLYDNISIDGVNVVNTQSPLSVQDITSGKHIMRMRFKNKTEVGNVNPIFGTSSTNFVKHIYIPSCVKKINTYAFYGCAGLNDVIIGDGVETIDKYAFSGCTSLQNIEIPDSVISIGDYAFQNCSLKSIYINYNEYNNYNGSQVTNKLGINNYNIEEIIFGNRIKSIGNYSFSYLSNLKKVVLSKSIQNIGTNAFYNCYNLETIIFNKSLKNISNYAFYGCSNLTNIDLSETNVKVIGTNAFYNCRNLTSVILPKKLETVLQYAFSYCPIKSLILPNSLTTIQNYAFSYSGLESVEITNPNTSFGTNIFYSCRQLKRVKLPDGLTTIPKYMFYECGLETIEIPNSVTLIDDGAFIKCTSLTHIQLSDSLTKISLDLFNGCTSLTEITIPASVTEICSYAFNNCTSLENLYCENENIIDITGIEVFNNTKLGQVINHIRYFTLNNIKYIVGIDTNDLSEITQIEIIEGVTSLRNGLFIGCTSLESISLPSTLTKINENCFKNCTGLTSIIIPDSVTIIDNSAFYGCTGLTDIELPNSVQIIESNAFYGCTGLTDIELPNTITKINGYAFYGCTGLTSITIPKSVTIVGNSMFKNCSSLTNIEILANIEFPSNAFQGCTGLINIEIPNTVQTIGSYAFEGCTGLTSITIPDSITSIGEYAFSGCTGLTSIELPNTITVLGQYAFNGCTGLTSINIPNTLTSIGNCMFQNCTSLTSIDIPNSITSIGQSVFKNCSSLENIEIPNTVQTIGSYAFEGCTGLISIELPNAITIIDQNVFHGCSSLISVNIPSSVTSIGYYAFAGCTSLTSIDIPNSVTSIGQSAFNSCSSLTSIDIPSSVTNIAYQAFSSCSSLTNVILHSNINIASQAFTGCSSLKHFDATYLTNFNSIFNSQTPIESLILNTTLYLSYAIQSLGLFTTNIKELGIGPNMINSLSQFNSSNWTSFVNLKTIIFTEGIEYLPSNKFYNFTMDKISFPSTFKGLTGGSSSLSSTDSHIRHVEFNCDPSVFTNIYGFSKNDIEEVTFNTGVICKLNNWYTSSNALKKINIGENVTGIDKGAFMNCYNLEEINILSNSITVGNNAFSGVTLIPNEVKTDLININEYAFGILPILETKQKSELLNMYFGIYVMKHDTSYNLQYNPNKNKLQFSKNNNTSGTLYYSLDNGETWNEYSEPVTNEVGDLILIKGNLRNAENYSIGKFGFPPESIVFGNIMSLLYEDNFADKFDLSIDCKFGVFKELFRCNGSPCAYISNAKYLQLPATTLISNCYSHMFDYSDISEAPELPATTLASSCYYSMFSHCNNLLEAPELPATTLASNCYEYMFYACKFTEAPELPATTLEYQCYQYMFQDSTNLTKAELPALTVGYQSYKDMFKGCSNLSYVKAMFTNEPGTLTTYRYLYGVASNGIFVKNPSATWTTTGYNGVPDGWTVIDGSNYIMYNNNSYEILLGADTELQELFNPFNLVVNYMSSNTNVATVNNDGQVSIVNCGNTTITASYAGDETFNTLSASYNITVKPIKWKQDTYILPENSNEKPELYNFSNCYVTLTSSDPNVANIDENGNIIYVGIGTTTLTAYADIRGEIFTETCELTLSEDIFNISYEEKTITLGTEYIVSDDNKTYTLKGKGIANSKVILTVKLNSSYPRIININMNVSSEYNYDFGYIGNINTDVTPSNYLTRMSGTGNSPQEIQIPAGESTIQIAYMKDGSSDSGSDQAIFVFETI